MTDIKAVILSGSPLSVNQEKAVLLDFYWKFLFSLVVQERRLPIN